MPVKLPAPRSTVKIVWIVSMPPPDSSMTSPALSTT
jgi:hypothetical protein